MIPGRELAAVNSLFVDNLGTDVAAVEFPSLVDPGITIPADPPEFR